MNIFVSRMDEDDMPRVADILHDAYYSTTGISSILYRSPPTEATRQRVIDHHVSSFRGDPTAMYWKIVNNDTNTIIACAKWHLYGRPGRSECEVSKAASIRDDEIFPEYEPDVYRALFEPLRKAHTEIMGSRPHMYLAMLVTHPSYERRGCGRILLEEGLRLADQQDLGTYLDATLAGKGLYQQYGFEEVRVVPFDLSRWGVKDVVEHSCMLRLKPR